MKHSLKSIFTKGNENISPADTTDLRRKKSAVISPALSGRNYFQMKKLYLIQLLTATIFFIGISNKVMAQGECVVGGCAVSANKWPTATQTTTSSTFVTITTGMYAGEYSLCNVTSGRTYEWSLCSADGGVTGYDSQLTLFNGTSNAILCFSDDYCNTDAKIEWVANFTGTVKIQVNLFDCLDSAVSTTLRWRSYTITPDAAVSDVYTMGTIATPFANPHVVKAQISNTGSTTISSLIVTLNVTGANTFTNNQTITSLAVGDSTIITFTGYTSLNTGTNIVNISVPSDANNTNNSLSVTQTVNSSSYNYAYGTTVVSGVGFDGATGDVALKFNTSSATSINTVNVNFNTSGQVYRVKIWDTSGVGGTPGTVLYTSGNLTTVLGITPVSISPAVNVNGGFYIGLEQVNTTNLNVSYQDEIPIRTQTFYYALPSGGTWTDFSPGANFRIMLEPVFGCALPSTPGTISGDTAVCLSSIQTHSIAAVTGATSYTWTLPSGWTGSSTTTSITDTAGATGGNITVTATNSCGTSTAQTLAVTILSIPAQPGLITGDNIVCSSATETYSVLPVSGAASYTWTLPSGWTGSSTTNSISAIAGTTGGNISVIANNACGSSSSQTLTVTVNQAPAQPGTISGQASVCEGTNQSYSITPVTGATSYTWTVPSGWTGTSTTTSITITAGVTSGNISVTANNSICSSPAQTLSITVITVPAQPGSITGNTTICSSSTKTYSVTPVSGASSYTWTLPSGWTGSSTTNSISATAGTSGGTISVIANNTCGSGSSQTLSVTVNQSPAQPGTISGLSTVCEGTTQSYTIAPVTGATSYTWTLPSGLSGASTSAAITVTVGTTGGNITVTANNTLCSSPAQTLNITVIPFANQPTAVISGTDPTCPGENTGSAVVSASGGTIPYSYKWNDDKSQTTATALNLSAGFYSVTVFDVNGCKVNKSVTLTDPAGMTLITFSTDANCGAADGSASVFVIGGTSPFIYNWSNGATASTITAVSAGIYTVTVTDSKGCDDFQSTGVNNIGAPTTSSVASDVSCFGDNDGSASVTAFGGIPPYTYSWSNGATTSAITGLSANDYIASVKDSLGCIATENVTINEPSALELKMSSTPESCVGNDGSASVVVSGGTFPYSYLWSNGATTSVITNRAMGTYSVIVTDANGCVDTGSVDIANSSGLSATIAVTIASCSNNNGTATANVSGGTSPYTYIWSNGATTSSISSLAVGTYTVTVKDAIGCRYIASASVASSPNVTFLVSVTPDTLSCTPCGSLTVNVLSGTPPYTISWSTGSTSTTISNISTGSYPVIVTDSKGCTATDSPFLNVIMNSSLNEEYSEDWIVSIYPNPTSGNFTVKVLSNVSISELNVYILNILGDELLHIQPKIFTGYTFNIDLSNYAKGFYFLKLQSADRISVRKVSLIYEK